MLGQSLARLWTHLIFSTKDRFPFLMDKQIREDMQAYLAQVLRSHDCATLIAGGVEDHVHALFALSRNFSTATVVKEVKRTSSIVIKEKTVIETISLAGRIRSIFGKSIKSTRRYRLHRETGGTAQAR